MREQARGLGTRALHCHQYSLVHSVHEHSLFHSLQRFSTMLRCIFEARSSPLPTRLSMHGPGPLMAWTAHGMDRSWHGAHTQLTLFTSAVPSLWAFASRSTASEAPRCYRRLALQEAACLLFVTLFTCAQSHRAIPGGRLQDTPAGTRREDEAARASTDTDTDTDTDTEG